MSNEHSTPAQAGAQSASVDTLTRALAQREQTRARNQASLAQIRALKRDLDSIRDDMRAVCDRLGVAS